MASHLAPQPDGIRICQGPKHIPALDGLRGLAILLVMMHHLFVLEAQSPIERVCAQIASFGKHGVDLFFVLSGFLITGILLDTKGNGRYFTSFYARRVLRIFPLYYTVLFLSLIVLPTLMSLYPPAAGKLTRFQGSAADWPLYAVFMTNYAVAFANRWRHGVLDVTWSLAIEEQFYLIWPIVVAAVTRRTLIKVCASVIIGSIAVRVACCFAGLSWLQIYVLTPCRVDSLACGAMIAAIVRSDDLSVSTTLKCAHYSLLGAVIFVATVLLSNGLEGESIAMSTVGYTAIATMAGCVLVMTRFSQPGELLHRVFGNSVLISFGKYSYAIYLFHLPIRAAIRDLAFGNSQFREYIGSGLLGQAFFYALAAMLCWVVARASWQLVESPFLELKRYFPYSAG